MSRSIHQGIKCLSMKKRMEKRDYKKSNCILFNTNTALQNSNYSPQGNRVEH